MNLEVAAFRCHLEAEAMERLAMRSLVVLTRGFIGRTEG